MEIILTREVCAKSSGRNFNYFFEMGLGIVKEDFGKFKKGMKFNFLDCNLIRDKTDNKIYHVFVGKSKELEIYQKAFLEVTDEHIKFYLKD